MIAPLLLVAGLAAGPLPAPATASEAPPEIATAPAAPPAIADADLREFAAVAGRKVVEEAPAKPVARPESPVLVPAGGGGSVLILAPNNPHLIAKEIENAGYDAFVFELQ